MNDKLSLLASEVVNDIEEEFYGLDIEFDNTYCHKLFYDLALLFYSKNIMELYKIEMLKYVKKCLIFINTEEKNDYTLFLNNLDILLEIDCIKEENLLKIKTDNIVNIEKTKLLCAM